MVSQGEVWLAALDPTRGSEIRKTRPVVIVSPTKLNVGLRTVICVPMTKGASPARFRVECEFRGVPGRVLTDQIRTLDKSRLLKRLGNLDDTTLRVILAKLRDVFCDP